MSPGSSAWLDRGFVTYSNAAKDEMLGVRAETLETHGAVSEPTVLEMVAGAIGPQPRPGGGGGQRYRRPRRRQLRTSRSGPCGSPGRCRVGRPGPSGAGLRATGSGSAVRRCVWPWRGWSRHSPIRARVDG